MSGKYALIIGNTEYTDPGLAQLTAPGRDTEDFARILRDKDLCAFDEVTILLNQLSSTVIEVIDEFFDQKKPDDLLVLYFSGHGVRDELGSLYLAVKNTIRTRLRSTAIKSDYIREVMDQSRSKRQVLIMDCCNSGAFAQGTKAATGVSIGTATAFEAGYGRIILTASDSTQFAWEGDKVIGETANSLFTHFLVQGLEGEADLDGDGRITVDEVYDYAYEKVRLATPKQTPSKFSSKQQGEIVLRQITRIEDIKPISLPEELIEATEDSRTFVREGAIRELEKLLKGKNLGLVRSAREALERIEREDDSRRVSQAATQALEAIRQAEKAEEERRAREEAERIAAQRAEEERIALEKAEALKLAERKAAEERRAKEEEEKRLAIQKAEEERLAREKAEAERKAKEGEEKLLRVQAEREATEREAARLKAERDLVEKAEREAIELAARRKAEREAKEKVAVKKSYVTSNPWLTTGAIGGGVIALLLCGFALLNNLPGIFGAPAATEPPSSLPTLLQTFEGHMSGVTSVAFSSDGQTLASASKDSTIRLWNVSDGSPLQTLEGHTDGVSSVAFSPDGETLASGSYDSTVRLWDVSDGALLEILEGHTDTVSSVAFSPDGQTLASGSYDTIVRLWNVSDGSPLQTLEGHINEVSSVAFSPDGETLASGSYDTTVRLWDVSDRSPLKTLEEHGTEVTSVAFSPDGQTLATGEFYDIFLWNVSDGSPPRTLEGDTGGVSSVTFSPDGQTLASGSYDSTVRLWDVSDGALLEILEGHTERVDSIVFSPDGQTLASGSDDGTIRLWGIAP